MPKVTIYEAEQDMYRLDDRVGYLHRILDMYVGFYRPEVPQPEINVEGGGSAEISIEKPDKVQMSTVNAVLDQIDELTKKRTKIQTALNQHKATSIFEY